MFVGNHSCFNGENAMVDHHLSHFSIYNHESGMAPSLFEQSRISTGALDLQWQEMWSKLKSNILVFSWEGTT